MSHRDVQRAWLRGILERELGANDRPLRPSLTDFQRAAADRLQAALDRFGGAILADEVGLGKTHTALELLAAHPPGAVIAPAALRTMWRRALDGAGLDQTPLVTHTALSRAQTDAELFPVPPALLVVDEAHAFTHSATRRYQRLASLAAASPLLLVTATPIGLHPRDLLSLIRLFCPLGALIPLLGDTPEDLLQHADSPRHDLEPLLRLLVVRRPRAFIQRLHPRGIILQTSTGSPTCLDFPIRLPTTLRTDLPADVFEPLLTALEALDERAVDAPAPLLRALLLSRLESSPFALDRSLSRLQAFLQRRLDALRAGATLDRGAWRGLFQHLTAEDDLQIVLPFLFDGASPASGEARSADLLTAQLDQVRAMRVLLQPLLHDPPRTRALIELLATLDPDAPALIFTRYTDTAEHLLRALVAASPARGVGILHGGGARIAGGPAPGGQPIPRDLLLDRFIRVELPAALRVSLLVATDVLAEGLNLQRCPTVVAFDLAFNPRRLIQRFGRADRLGPPGRTLRTVLMLPDQHLERVLDLLQRLTERLDHACQLLDLPTHDELRWLRRALTPGTDPMRVALEHAQPPTVDLHLEYDLTLLRRAPRPAAPAALPLGWALPATPRCPAGTLFLLALEDDPIPLRWVFIADSERSPSTRRDLLYPRLRTLLTRTAAQASAPPPHHLRAALTLALHLHTRRRAAAAQLVDLPAASAPNRLLRLLAALPPPQPWEHDAIHRLDQLNRLLRAPLPTHLNALIRSHLDARTPLDAWLPELLTHAPEATAAVSDADADVHLIGFIHWYEAPP